MAKPRNKRKRSVKVSASPPTIPQELAGEISFRESALFRGYRPTPYNPDELVGQKGLTIYKKMMVDEQVKAAVLAKHYAVLASGYEIIPPDSEDADKEQVNKEMTDFIKFNFEEMEGSFDSKLLEILSATCYGFSVSEKIFHYIDYGPFGGKIGLKTIKTRQPFDIDFDVDEYGNLMDDGILQSKTVRMPKQKFIVYVHRKAFDNFYGEPDLRSAFRPYWMKDTILRFMAITLERYGEPTPIFKHAQRLSALQKSELVDFISKKGTKSGIIIPADITLDFQTPDPRTGTVYVPAIDLCDTHIRVALLMPGLIGMSAEQAVGSLARSQTEFDAFLWVIEQLRRDIETIVDEEAIKQPIDLNYDVIDSKYPRFRFKKITEEIKQGLFKIWSEAVNGNALTKTREDENKARGLIDFPPLPDDVPMKGGLQAPGVMPGQPAGTPADSGGTTTEMDSNSILNAIGIGGGGEEVVTDEEEVTFQCAYCGLKRYHLPGQHDQCDHSPTGECDAAKSPDLQQSGLLPHADAWFNKLDTKHKKALKNYSGELYDGINTKLRSGTTMHKNLNASVEALDNAIQQFVLPKEVTVYRGAVLKASEIQKLVTAKEFTDKAFVSTSQSRAVVSDFMRDASAGEEAIMFRMKLPAGFKAAPMERAGINSQERELLLPRGMKYRVVAGETKGKVKILDVVPIA